MRTLTILAGLLVLAATGSSGQEVAFIVDQPDTPVRITEFAAQFDEPVPAQTGRKNVRPRSPGQKNLVVAESRVSNDSNRKIVALRIGFVFLNVFDEHMGTVYSYSYDELGPGGEARMNGAYSRSEVESFRTGLAFVDAVRFEDGGVWKSSRQDIVGAVERAGGKIDPRFQSP